jgi:hypothetical protein
MDNYRLISLISNITNLSEKIIKSILQNYLDYHNLLSLKLYLDKKKAPIKQLLKLPSQFIKTWQKHLTLLFNLRWIEHINTLTTKITKFSYAFKQHCSINHFKPKSN